MNPIKLIHTKILLEVMNEFRVFNTCNENREEKFFTSGHYMYEIINDKLYVYVPTFKTFGPVDMKFKSVLMDENSVRLELSTREHIPNKLERKQIRRNKAKAKKNR